MPTAESAFLIRFMAGNGGPTRSWRKWRRLGASGVRVRCRDQDAFVGSFVREPRPCGAAVGPSRRHSAAESLYQIGHEEVLKHHLRRGLNGHLEPSKLFLYQTSISPIIKRVIKRGEGTLFNGDGFHVVI